MSLTSWASEASLRSDGDCPQRPPSGARLGTVPASMTAVLSRIRSSPATETRNAQITVILTGDGLLPPRRSEACLHGPRGGRSVHGAAARVAALAEDAAEI